MKKELRRAAVPAPQSATYRPKSIVSFLSITADAELICEFDDPVYGVCGSKQSRYFDLKIEPSGKGQRLHIVSHTKDRTEGLCKAGCFIQGIDPQHRAKLQLYHPRADPIVSCIILITFNDLFVRQFLIPSIIANTSIPYEIIIVYNGVGADMNAFAGFQVIESETGCVAKGYNKGVAAAKGKFIAIFHDDCIVLSPDWHEQMMKATERMYYAVSTESQYQTLDSECVFNASGQVEFLKGTPLFMKKTDYDCIGGHDEFFFAGIEDIEFSYRIQRKGLRIKKLSIPYRHFNGMSSVILLSDCPGMMKLLFGYGLIPADTIVKWKVKLLSPADVQQKMYAVHRENALYFKKKSMLPPGSDDAAARQMDVAQYPFLSRVKAEYQEWLRQRF